MRACRWAATRWIMPAILVASGCQGTPTALRARPAASAGAVVTAASSAPVSSPPAPPTGSAAPGTLSSPLASGPSLATSPTPPSLPLAAATLSGTVTVPVSLATLAGIVSNNGVGIVSNNGGGIIGNNGGGVISDNGGGVVSNNGGNYRLAATGDLPLAGFTVRLVDAAGQPVLGADGKPLVTLTDGSGAYRFTTALPAHNVIVTGDMPKSVGSLAAIAPGDAGASRSANLELVSTLTTDYILDQYVRGQADPVATLEKLPGAVEATTRQKASAALDSAKLVLPSNLALGTVVAAVTQLRAADTAFDAQMEIVRKLLVVAGLSDLGNGQPASTVFLGTIRAILPLPDGTTVVDADQAWRIDAAGLLSRIDVTGSWSGALAVDDQGRYWRGGADQLQRRNADGSLTDMSHGQKIRLYTLVGGDSYMALLDAPSGQPVPLVLVSSDGTVKQLSSLQGDLAYPSSVAHDAAGNVLLEGLLGSIPAIGRAAPATGTITTVKSGSEGGQFFSVNMDPLGNVFYKGFNATDAHAIRPDGSDSVIPGLTAVPLAPTCIAMAVDGSVYVSDAASVYVWRGGKRTLYAGKVQQAVGPGAVATSVALQKPTDLAVATDGTLYVLDGGSVLKIAPGGATTTLVSSLKDGSTTLTPTQLRLAPDGTLIVGAGGAATFGIQPPLTLFKLDLAAPTTPTVLYRGTLPTATFTVGADGTLYVAEMSPGYIGGVVAVAPDGHVTQVLDPAVGAFAIQALSFDVQGRLLILTIGSGTDAKSWQWSPGTGLVVRDSAVFWPVLFDASGRAYADGSQLAAGATTIDRLDVTTGKPAPLIGPGGQFFTGTGVDDGVDHPREPRLDGQGNLYFLDTGHKQIKRVDASAL